MHHGPGGAILPDDFIHTLLTAAAEAVDAFRQDQPDYRAFLERRAGWNNTLKKLGKSLLYEYDNEVHMAFIDYQEIFENYHIVKGLMETIGKAPRPAENGREAAVIPGLAEAERRLDLACRRFVGRLDEKTGAQCAGYLRLRRQVVDTGGPLCRRCGAELAEGLLERL